MEMIVDQREMILKGVRNFRKKKAFIYMAGKPKVIEGTALTFGETNARANRLAHGLAELGHQGGSIVATLAQNCLHYPEIEFGLMKGAFPQAVLNPMLSGKELEFQISKSGASVLIFQSLYADLIKSIRSHLPTIRHFICFDGKKKEFFNYESLLDSASCEEPTATLDPNGLGELRFTGGTTGTPKGIMLPFKSAAAVTRDLLMEYLGDLTSEDKWLAIQPLFHGAGWFLLPIWVKGMTQYIVNDFHSETALEIIEKEKITAIKTIPTVLMRLLDSPEIQQRDLSSVKTIIYGGEPLPAQRLKQAIKIFGNVFIQLYGQTEAPMIIAVAKKEDYRNERLYKSVGRPATMVKVKIIDRHNREVGPGEMGEIAVSGDHLMTGYLDDQKATNEVLIDGWLHTRDLGMLDEEGYLFLSGGRTSDMIISGGENVYPQEVEQVLYQHSAVNEACVFGIPDKKWGEAITAAIALKPGVTASSEELIEFCKGRLASYKKPQRVCFLPELPKSGAGKVFRKELRELFSKTK